VLEFFFRLVAEVGPAANWIMIVLTAVVAVFLLYIGIALWATLRETDPGRQKIAIRSSATCWSHFSVEGTGERREATAAGATSPLSA